MIPGTHSTPLAELPFSELIKNCHLLEMAKRIGQAVIDLFVSVFTCLSQTIYRCITFRCCVSEEMLPAPLPSPLSPPPLPSPTLPAPNAPLTNPIPVDPKVAGFSAVSLEDLEMMRTAANDPAQIEVLDRAILARKQAQSDKLMTLSSPLLTGGSFKENRKIALARIAEITTAIEVNLVALQLDPEAALQELAERETGTKPLTLKKPPEGMTLDGVIAKIQGMSLRAPPCERWNWRLQKNEIIIPVNQDRINVWPTGIRAAERLVELRQKPDAALLRLAQLKATESLFLIKEEIDSFDLDDALKLYSSAHRTSSLEQWFDFVYKGVTPPAGVDFVKYKNVIHKCDPNLDVSTQAGIAREYLSKLHDILLTRQKEVMRPIPFVQEAALQELAEKETGTEPLTLQQPPEGMTLDETIKKIQAMPPTVECMEWNPNSLAFEAVKKVNPHRLNVWPAGIRAVEKLLELREKPEEAIARLTELKAKEEEAFKSSVARRVDSFISIGAGCVDQMNSQLERELLELLSEDVPGNKTLSEQIAFQASLALTQYRSTLITATTQRLYNDDPDVGSEMADFERAVKKELMTVLKLQGKINATGAAFYSGRATKEKVDNIKETVRREYSPTTLLLDFCQSDNQELFRSIKRLRSTMIQHVNGLCGLDDVEETTDPLIKALSASTGHTALYAGPTTAEGTLFYLEAIGVLVRKG